MMHSGAVGEPSGGQAGSEAWWSWFREGTKANKEEAQSVLAEESGNSNHGQNEREKWRRNWGCDGK